jgi:adenylate kinase
MGDIFRAQVKENSELGRKVKSYVEKGALVPDETVIEVLKQHLDKIPEGTSVILDGFLEQLNKQKRLTQSSNLMLSCYLTCQTL